MKKINKPMKSHFKVSKCAKTEKCVLVNGGFGLFSGNVFPVFCPDIW